MNKNGWGGPHSSVLPQTRSGACAGRIDQADCHEEVGEAEGGVVSCAYLTIGVSVCS